MATMIETPRPTDVTDLSIAVIGPDYKCRNAATGDLAGCRSSQIREFTSYPSGSSDIQQMLRRKFDVFLVELDSDPDAALNLVEGINSHGPSTVMVYSALKNPDLLVRSMRAGAREFFTLPFPAGTMFQALMRASVSRPFFRPKLDNEGKLLVFIGAKGGSGVTTLACNFAVSLAKGSGKSALLIDLNLPLGDAAISLGINSSYTTVDALKNINRLDTSFLSTLVTQHSSGLAVLAAPGDWAPSEISTSAVNKLLDVAREKYDYVIVDAGSKLELHDTDLFQQSSTIYLVTQVGIPELRNSNCLISQLTERGNPSLEIVINRFNPDKSAFSEADFTLGLTRSPQWRIPNDYLAVQRMQKTAVPLTFENSAISLMIQKMARTLSGQPEVEEKKKKFGLYQRDLLGWNRLGA